jgi:hypothetical protein
MTDVTRLLENPVEATTIVQNFVLLLVKPLKRVAFLWDRSIPLLSWRRCTIYSDPVLSHSHFAEALAGTINVVLYAEFDNVIEIDRNRQVLFDYSA